MSRKILRMAMENGAFPLLPRNVLVTNFYSDSQSETEKREPPDFSSTASYA